MSIDILLDSRSCCIYFVDVPELKPCTLFMFTSGLNATEVKHSSKSTNVSYLYVADIYTFPVVDIDVRTTFDRTWYVRHSASAVYEFIVSVQA